MPASTPEAPLHPPPHPTRRLACLALGLVLALALPAPGTAAGKSPPKTLEERLREAYGKAVKDSVSLPGLLHLRRKEGHLYAELGTKDMGKDLLLLPKISRGVGQGFLLGGLMRMGQELVLRFEKGERDVRVLQRNVRFTAEEGSPMEKAVAASFSDSVLASLPIVGLGPGGSALVRLDELFLSDLLGLADEVDAALAGGYSFDAALSRWEDVKAFPENLELRATLGFSGGSEGEVDSVPDPRHVQLGVHLSLIAMPDRSFEPRLADDRVGHFLQVRRDFSRSDPEGPTVRYVGRWRLEKADVKADRSPVKHPVVFYVGRDVPYRWRPYLRAGVLEWNRAFEKVGFLDALEVRYQSDEDTWEAEDARYNTIRWALGDVPFGAIGPSHANPLTGEILDADILFSGAIITGFWRSARLFGAEERAALAGAVGADLLARPSAPPFLGPGVAPARPLRQAGRPACELGAFMAREFGLAAAHALGSRAAEASVAAAAATTATSAAAGTDGLGELPEAFVGAALKYIAMHEVGHTLGLRHNFKGSAAVPRARLHDAAFTRAHGLSGSVMDYLPANLAPPGTPPGETFTSTLGPYDYWAIEYAYKPVKKPEELEAIAARAAEPALAYASDEDRAPLGQRNLDPLVHAGDLGDDPLAFARERLDLIDRLWGGLAERVVGKGRSYGMLRAMATGLLASIHQAGALAAVYVGGQYHHRDHKGDPNERAAFVPVPPALQRQALDLLVERLFSDRTWGRLEPALLNRLAPSHWDHWGETPGGDRLDYPLHRVVRQIQLLVLWRLLNPWVLERIQDGERQAAPEADRLGVAELLDRLSAGIFQELEAAPSPGSSPRRSYVSSFRRTLQRSYLETLGFQALHLGALFSSDGGAQARRQLVALQPRLRARLAASGAALDLLGRAHLEDLEARLAEVLAAERAVDGF